MAAVSPELTAILEQVTAELQSMLLAGEVGQVTIHCGRGDLSVEVTSRRKYEPVRIEQGKRLAVVKAK